jgi:hypothetical protein
MGAGRCSCGYGVSSPGWARPAARNESSWLNERSCVTVRRAKEPASETLPLEERVCRRAYELYILRGNQSGSDLVDWLQAEQEIRRAQEQSIDEASEESFPASDPPAY